MPKTLFQFSHCFLHRSARYLDGIQNGIIQFTQWLVLLMTLMVSVVIVSRLFNIGSIALQESITYMHASALMMSLSYTALAGGHVRVDIFYRRYSPLNKAWTNLLGTCLFLLPFAVFLSFITWESAVQSWRIRESSNNPGGLPFIYILKSLPPLGGVLLTLHAVSEIFKQLAFISIKETDIYEKGEQA